MCNPVNKTVVCDFGSIRGLYVFVDFRNNKGELSPLLTPVLFTNVRPSNTTY